MKIKYSNQLLINKLLFNLALIASFCLLGVGTKSFYILPLIVILVLNLYSYAVLLVHNKNNYFINSMNNEIYYKRVFFKDEVVKLSNIKNVTYKKNQLIIGTNKNEKKCIPLNNISVKDKEMILNLAFRYNKKSP